MFTRFSTGGFPSAAMTAFARSVGLRPVGDWGGLRSSIGEGHEKGHKVSDARPVARSLRGRHLQGSTCRCQGRRSHPTLAGVRAVLRRSAAATMPSLAEVRPGSARLTRSPARPRTPRPARDFVTVHDDPFAHVVRPLMNEVDGITVAGRFLIVAAASRPCLSHAARRRRGLALACRPRSRLPRACGRCQGLTGPLSRRDAKSRRKRPSDGVGRRDRGGALTLRLADGREAFVGGVASFRPARAPSSFPHAAQAPRTTK